MSRQNRIAHQTHILPDHHIYQLGTVFLFALGFFLMSPFYMLIKEFQLDMAAWQWYFIIPWSILYSVYCLMLRAKIKSSKRINPLKRPIGHWVLFGLVVIMLHWSQMI